MIILRIKSGYIVKKVMGSYMLVSLEGEGSTMQTMNETGAFLWDALSSDTTIAALTEKMVKEYDIDAATAQSDIENFVARLRAAGLLDE